MKTITRPYKKVNIRMDLDDIEKWFSDMQDDLYFGVEVSLLNMLADQINSDEYEAITELLNIVDKMKDLITTCYHKTTSEFVENLLW